MKFKRFNQAGASRSDMPSRVREIRRRFAEGETQRALGQEFGLSPIQIGRITRRESWAWVEDAPAGEPLSHPQADWPPRGEPARSADPSQGILNRLLQTQQAVNASAGKPAGGSAPAEPFNPLDEGEEK